MKSRYKRQKKYSSQENDYVYLYTSNTEHFKHAWCVNANYLSYLLYQFKVYYYVLFYNMNIVPKLFKWDKKGDLLHRK